MTFCSFNEVVNEQIMKIDVCLYLKWRQRDGESGVCVEKKMSM